MIHPRLCLVVTITLSLSGDVETGEERHQLTGHTDRVYAVAICADANIALSASWDHTVKVWDIHKGELIRILEGHREWVEAVAIAEDGTIAVSASWDKTLKVWDIVSGACLATFTADKPLEFCAISADKSIILAGGHSGFVHFLQYKS